MRSCCIIVSILLTLLLSSQWCPVTGQSLRTDLTLDEINPETPMSSYMCLENGLDHLTLGYTMCSRRLSKAQYRQVEPRTDYRVREGPRRSMEILTDNTENGDAKDGDTMLQEQPLEVIESNSYMLCTCTQWHMIAPYGDRGIFSERNGHAVTVFKGKLWLVGGRSKLYKKWDLSDSYRRADVWYSYNGRWWIQEMKLLGDFYHQNKDVLIPGPVAPWWERFGHSLNTMSVMNRTRNGALEKERIPEAMVLFGGYAPDPMNDLWISLNGNTWNKVFFPPNADFFNENKMNTWPTARAYHGSTIYEGDLWIVGGTPLNNEVWRASNLTITSEMPAGERVIASRYFTVVWTPFFTRIGLTGTNVPFMPRAGLMITSQKVMHLKKDAGVNHNPLIELEGDDDEVLAGFPHYPYTYPYFDHKGIVNHTVEYEYLYVMGGFASWPGDDPRYDGGKRARNDVWRAGGPRRPSGTPATYGYGDTDDAGTDDAAAAATDDAAAAATDDATAAATDDAAAAATDDAATAAGERRRKLLETDNNDALFGLQWTRMDTLKKDGVTKAVTEQGHGGGVFGGEAGAPWPARAFGALTTWHFESSPEWVGGVDYHLSRITNVSKELNADGSTSEISCEEQRNGKGSPYCRTETWLGTRSIADYQDVTVSAYQDANENYYVPKGWQGLYAKRMEQINDIMDTFGNVRKKKDQVARAKAIAQLKRSWIHDEGMFMAPRMWLSGGAYFGTKGNQNVRTLEGYVDLWWSRDGVEWFQVSEILVGDDSGYGNTRNKARTGKPRAETLKSSSECFKTEVNDAVIYLGKYGHTMLPFRPIGVDTPSLFLIGGDTVDEGITLPDVFQSSNGILCELYDRYRFDTEKTLWEETPEMVYKTGKFYTCSGHGVCDQILPVPRRRDYFYNHQRRGKGSNRITPQQQKPDKRTVFQVGCFCDLGYTGEYCEGRDPNFVAAAMTTPVISVLSIGVFFFGISIPSFFCAI